ncbi:MULTISPECIES: transketolase [Thermodesulfovibrio]|uniref:Transketolase n=1 Tax=Thermodesulfovibrio yellowstonii (strain ATCC 51303 / DSM 11347 / YP87) TaxID=289376 RepID=B5YKM2_THEYD|nr:MULTISPECIES: transketolase [Thermodesulfovibrio]ACI21679.1 transketolase [Thermodesulfovibrio yellowstonii DSM 11347]MDI6865995.1 transketolase [Thermodesulfovibrio yellowstonii]
MSYLTEIAKLLRYYILKSTTQAGSGHPTTCLSSVELMASLLFGGFFHFDADNPDAPNNDRLIFSKGHAAPLLYSLWTVAGKLTEEELLTLRKFGSPLEGHPVRAFPYSEAATGSLGQGLSIGVGMAINGKYIDRLPYRVFVLLGDSEMAEGSVWEAIQLAAYYQLDNLIGIIDVNRLGQRGETMYGHDLDAYAKRISAFGWKTICIDGHEFNEIFKAYEEALKSDAPTMIIAKTIKGKGVSFLEDKEGRHGVALTEAEFKEAIKELGEVKKVTALIKKPEELNPNPKPIEIKEFSKRYSFGEMVATRRAYGEALVKIFPEFPDIVVLDAEVSNSTYAEIFKKYYPERFFECFVAEQNMVGMAVGLALRGKIPFVSTFAAFLARAFDHIRMAQYSEANIKFVGSHAGVSIGQDGPSQMGLEDIAMMRSILNSVVLYPSDAVSTEKLVREAAKHNGIVYIRTTRSATPVIYSYDEEFPIGGSKVLKASDKDLFTVVGAGITLHEALKAYEELKNKGIYIRVIDLYSVKPLDTKTLKKALSETKAIITVEDHYPAGGIGEAVKAEIGSDRVYSLACRKTPKSGTPEELLDYEEISAKAIVSKVLELTNKIS